MPRKPYNPLCEVCHGRPKMDRSSCCEECWYSGRYSRAADEKRHGRPVVLSVMDVSWPGAWEGDD